MIDLYAIDDDENTVGEKLYLRYKELKEKYEDGTLLKADSVELDEVFDYLFFKMMIHNSALLGGN